MILDFDLVDLTATVLIGLEQTQVIMVDPDGVAIIMEEVAADIAVIDLLALAAEYGGPDAVVELLLLRDVALSLESLMDELEQYAEQSDDELAA